MARSWVAIIDFGSQYTQLIARRVREQNVYSEIVGCDITAAELRQRQPSGIIISDGPYSTADEAAPQCDPAIFDLGIPVMGICYGMHLMARALGGTVKPGGQREHGFTRIAVMSGSRMLAGLPKELDTWMSLGDEVSVMPPGFKASARSLSCPIVLMRNEERKLFGMQFHPEAERTQFGEAMLHNFLFPICKCSGEWTTEAWIGAALADLRRQVDSHGVLLGLSGGVDSSVMAVLLHRAVGKKLTGIFVDNGLTRAGEAEQVATTFRDRLGMNLRVVDARARFFAALKGIKDPERKRKIIGREFVRVFADEARALKDCAFLAQGTIYSDVLESAGGSGGARQALKSHHNVGGLPRDLSFKLVEPLRDLFKDEVRAVGRALGLPDELVDRQPFPGPGMAVRILGEVTEERVRLLQQADLLVQEEMRKWSRYNRVWQSFAVLLPVRSVGVTAGRRTYENVCALRVVDSSDAMSAEWTRVPHDILDRISSRVINEVNGINRVVFDISSKPPATIEWE